MSHLRQSLICILLLLGCSAKQTFFKKMPASPARIFSRLPKSCIFKQNGATGAIFISHYYGFSELWMLYHEAKSGWRHPLYMAQPILTDIPYSWMFVGDSLIIKALRQATNQGRYKIRKPFLAFADSSRLSMAQIVHDADNDGLADYAEEVLWTDASNPDTDGDGLEDGLDTNPFADDSLRLTQHERLHKQVIETRLRALDSDQLVVVVQPGKRAIPYTRRSGIVLCMPADKVDEYIETQGYGIPVLSAAIKDTLDNHKVDFTFFVAPDSAWGFEALYGPNKKHTAWKRKILYKEWGVTP
jgi:hypothetical protein